MKVHSGRKHKLVNHLRALMFALFDVTQTLVAREMCVFPDWLVSGFCRLLAVTGYNQLQKLREL